MPTATTDVLIQGLFACGSYEKGQAFIKDHAGEITHEFVSALRETSMNLLTGEQAPPTDSPVFAELAVVAAIVLGDDEEKGMSDYCEGSVLSRLGNYREAICRLDEAEAYLRRGTNSQQLANCLYDNALCHHKLGELSRALRLLEEALPYQNTEKERADTLAFMLVLEQQSGNLTGTEDSNDFLHCAFLPSSGRRIQFRETTDVQEKGRICDSLSSHHPALRNQALFRNSIPHFLASSECAFFAADDTARTSDQWPPYAYGLVKQYRDTFNDRDLLGLEAVCFADSDSTLHWEIIEGLKKMAQDRNIWAVCISAKSFSHVAGFRALKAGRRDQFAFGSHAGCAVRDLFRLHRIPGDFPLSRSLYTDPRPGGTTGFRRQNRRWYGSALPRRRQVAARRARAVAVFQSQGTRSVFL